MAAAEDAPPPDVGASASPPPPAAVDPALAPLCACVRTLIDGVGEDAGREGLVDTPKRVAKAWLDMTAGYKADIDSILNGALFHEPGVGAAPGLAGCVLVRDVEFASTSERDLAPFYGRLHIAYVPGTSGVVLGLSKVARLAKVLARRLTHQAALADAVLAAFVGAVRPRGAAVLVEARAVGRPGPAAAPGGPGLVVTTAAAGCCADGLGGGPSVTEVLALLRLRGAVAGGTAPLPASASCGAAGGAWGAAPLPPLPPSTSGGGGLVPSRAASLHRPASGGSNQVGAKAGAVGGAPVAPSPLTPGPATPARGGGCGGASSSDGDGVADDDDDDDDDDADPSCTYVHAGEVLWANGHGGVGAGRERRCCAGGEGEAGVAPGEGCGSGGGAPSPPPASALPRPPSAAADLHLRGRGGGAGTASGNAPGSSSSSPPPAPSPALPSLEPCPARRGAVPPAARAAMVAAVTRLLSLAGDDPARPGLRGSADRYVDGLLASTAGYDADVEGVIAGALAARAAARQEQSARSENGAAPVPPTIPPAAHAAASASPTLLLPPPCVDVAVRFTSMCEHHMLPFHGVARVVCLVDGEEGGPVVGGGGPASGPARRPTPALDPRTVSALVRAYALRLQVQERLTQQVAEAVHAAAGAPRRGTLVVVEAAHMCMVARGVEQHGSATVTVGARGELAVDGVARRELLGRLVSGG